MVVLKAIGSFFARIGRWIRDTAWVQPLLIVGGIFAIIFSIPYLTNWIKSWGGSSTAAYKKYYDKTALSLKNVDEGKSEVDDIFKYLLAIEDGKETEEQKKKYGEKFFLSFVQEGCSGCENNYYGFKYLQDKYTTSDKDSQFYLEGGAFKMHSIYMDQAIADLDEYDNIFDHFILENYQQVFERIAGDFGDASNYQYLINKGSSYRTQVETLAETCDSPTIFLVDITPDSKATVQAYGVTEVLFTVDGKDNDSTSYGKALTLADCWNHADIFAEGYRK